MANINSVEFLFLDQVLYLHPYHAVYWKDKNMLWLADVHLGKAAHFRKSGVPIPNSVHMEDYRKMERLIEEYMPEKILFLGDLFHSSLNNEWIYFKKWIKKYTDIKFSLISGNHDILEIGEYSGLEWIPEYLMMPPFLFSHKPININDLYNVCGHLHPGVVLKSEAMNHIRIPCFYFGKSTGILPAFGNFTGCTTMDYDLDDNIFIIAEEQVVKWV
ncbi:MAG: ligase-associated DNA damage response endonuclease PdeM [Cyclobacteriaceae bacterium]|nr:ligase-associated DNA damage response endonuclease PdeM [Cyclobacteriaceae bacterium]